MNKNNGFHSAIDSGPNAIARCRGQNHLRNQAWPGQLREIWSFALANTLQTVLGHFRPEIPKYKYLFSQSYWSQQENEAQLSN